MAQKITRIRPQQGYQMKALSSPADIVIGGGSAGVGKTFTLLLDPIRYTPRTGFGGVIFRRTSTMIRAEGGLWDASMKLYSHIDGAFPRSSKLEWQFNNGVKIKFSHLEYEKNVYDWQGSEIPFIGFDELTHFTKKMFFYLLSRNRSTCGVKPYVRATCNPDPDSWVRELIDWWIGEDGLPIPERQGVLRYFMVDNDNYIWGNSVEEVIEAGWHVIKDLVEKSREKGNDIRPEHFVKSITFIGGSIYDNRELLKVDPNYLSNLNSQSKSDKARLLDGNWNEKETKDDVYHYKPFKSIFTNHFLLEKYKYSKTYITSDIAMKGSDKFVVLVWRGKMIIDFKVMDRSNGREVIEGILEMAYKHQVPQYRISFDNDGVGQFIDGFIEDAQEFVNNARAIDGEQYKNLKSQCYLKSGDAVTNNEYYVPEHVANRMFDDKHTFKQQMMRERKAIKRAKPDHDGKLATIPKHEMKPYLDGKSPDLMDAFSQREYHELIGDAPDVMYTH